MKIHEIIHEIIHEDNSFDDENPDRNFPNPLPIVDASEEFDILDDIEQTFIDEYKRENGENDIGLGEIGKIVVAGREKYGDIEQVPIDQIGAIEPYLYADHLKSLVGGGNVKASSKYPFLLKYNGRYIAADGTHRIVAAMQRGEGTIQALVIDLNK